MDDNYGPAFDGTPCPPEPPVGTWVKDRFGGVSRRQAHGWGAPGVMPFGKWPAMWAARGPYVRCGEWGADLPEGVSGDLSIPLPDHSELKDLRERLGKALTELTALKVEENGKRNPLTDRLFRLNGKIEGVKLALSYVEEAIR